MIEEGEKIFGILHESGCDPLVEEVLSSINQGESQIEIGRDLYDDLATLMRVDTKY